VLPPPLPPASQPATPPPLPGSSARSDSARSHDGVPSAPNGIERSTGNRAPTSSPSLPPRPPLPKPDLPPLPKQAVPAPIPNLRSGPIRRRPPGDKQAALSSNDLIVEERPSNLNLSRDVLRVPTRMLAPEPMGEHVAPLVDVLFRSATMLLDQLSVQYESDWPATVVSHATTVCDRLGLLPRAQRELLLVARTHAVLTLILTSKGPLPSPRQDRLGYQCNEALDGLLTMLQSEFVDFFRLPQDDDPPLGMRIVSTVLEGLYLFHQGQSEGQLAQQLRSRFGDTDVVRTLLEHFADDPPHLSGRNEPPMFRPAKLPPPQMTPTLSTPLPQAEETSQSTPLRCGWPAPAVMPDVAWSIEMVSSLPEEGLLPYPAQAKPKRPESRQTT
ncbi:MAG TPA: hypothetical protein PKW11_16255, partial [Pseudomonadota bacterium]|nr:hypothetical protein [Pseudomonadota bacterium]